MEAVAGLGLTFILTCLQLNRRRFRSIHLSSSSSFDRAGVIFVQSIFIRLRPGRLQRPLRAHAFVDAAALALALDVATGVAAIVTDTNK